MIEKYETLVIYHADCLDGLGAAWSAFCKLGNHARYIPARHGDEFPAFEAGAVIYILDFSYPPEQLLAASRQAGQIILIDHHITAMEQCEVFFHRSFSADPSVSKAHETRSESRVMAQPLPENLALYFDMARSGCVLAWQHFFPERQPPKVLLHIEDRDLWKFKLAGTREITSALYERMPMTLPEMGTIDLDELLQIGRMYVEFHQKIVKRLEKIAHPVMLNGQKGLAVNASSSFSSELGHVLAEKSGTFGMTYQYDGRKQKWQFSLRSIGDYDVGHLAQAFGGGGHKNAAGFVLDDNPFIKRKGS
ncbi:DHHA1 domain-containing protein [Methylobacter sp. sgz302048]|uniref:DHHA1 domain-containing protein n=1 Tax=Methylobacter sp. sgz302048 TaxID=3455945 RepID=UPI003FA05718